MGVIWFLLSICVIVVVGAVVVLAKTIKNESKVKASKLLVRIDTLGYIILFISLAWNFFYAEAQKLSSDADL